MNCTLLEKWLQLQAIVLADWDSDNEMYPVYLFSETQDNEASVLTRGYQLSSEGIASKLVVVDDVNRNNAGYPGAAIWINRLMGLGVHHSDIVSIPCNEGLNTFSESLALIGYTQRMSWPHIGIVAPPFHQLRAFLSILGAMRKLDVKIRAYNCVGDDLPWNETVHHSQGTLLRTRRELVAEEMRRIEKYTQKGDLVTIDEALGYLDWRDTA